MSSAVVTAAPRFPALENLRSRLHLDATTLKIIAVVLMFADHIHQMFGPMGAPQGLSMVGRIVFPIFLFLMADSFHYTRNRKKFLTRLFIASTVMSLGSMIISIMFPNPYVVLMNNAFSTFLVAGLYMWFYDIIRDGVRTHNAKRIVKGALLCLVPIITAIPMFLVGSLADDPYMSLTTLRVIIGIAGLVPNLLMVEGGFLMVVLGLLFYIFRENRWIQIAIFAALSIFVLIHSGPADIQWMMIFAIPFMLLYNGKAGRGMKDFFYAFYPAHIWILYIISTLLIAFNVLPITEYYQNLTR